MFTASDVIILGAGMAGASLAAELAPHRKVVLVEIEDQPGRHATGRSAAMFFESYGNATVRTLTRASRAFLERPPAEATALAFGVDALGSKEVHRIPVYPASGVEAVDRLTLSRRSVVVLDRGNTWPRAPVPTHAGPVGSIVR